MMTSPRIDACHYRFSETDRLLLDANVWYLLYGINAPDDRRVLTYSRVFRNIREARSRVYVDVVILSEFINRLVAFHYAEYKNTGGRESKKGYRNSPAFVPAAEAIAASVRAILRDSERVESCFMTADLEAVLARFEEGGCDFNDEVIASLCAEREFVLLTDDSDFCEAAIPLMTANRRLLDSRRT